MAQTAQRCQTCGEVLTEYETRLCSVCQPANHTTRRRAVDEYEQMAGSLIDRGLARATVRNDSMRPR